MGNVINASKISEYLDTKLLGEDMVLERATSLNSINNNSLAFINKVTIKENKAIKVLYLVPLDKKIDKNSKASYIQVKNPRLAFAKVVNEFFVKKFKEFIEPSAQIGKNVKIAKNVYIGKNSVIGDNVSIGDNTIIRENVVIHHNIEIGKNCLIKAGVVIGEDGFGFEYEKDGTPVKLPHLGNVVIGNNVEIGANAVVARGTLDDTIIHDDVKIDALVHIAHNCYIGKKTSLIAGAILSGSVIIGEKCWIAPNSTIFHKRTIGDNAKVGLGATVIDNIKNNSIVMGLEAIEVTELYKFKLKNKYQYKK